MKKRVKIAIGAVVVLLGVAVVAWCSLRKPAEQAPAAQPELITPIEAAPVSGTVAPSADTE